MAFAVSPSQEMVDQGVAREVVNRVQRLRKKANLNPTDAIAVHYEIVKDSVEVHLADVLTAHGALVAESLAKPFVAGAAPAGAQVVIEELSEVKDASFKIIIVRA